MRREFHFFPEDPSVVFLDRKVRRVIALNALLALSVGFCLKGEDLIGGTVLLTGLVIEAGRFLHDRNLSHTKPIGRNVI